MKMIKHTVEVENSKRFTIGKDKVAREVMKPSATIRKSGEKTFHQYSGQIPAAEASDFQSAMDSDPSQALAGLAQTILRDLYVDHKEVKTPAEAIAHVLNNNGLRLNYGDWIKDAHRIGVGSLATFAAAMDWLINQDDASLLIDYKSQPEGERRAWLLEAYRTKDDVADEAKTE